MAPTRRTSRPAISPDWSPDGTRLAYDGCHPLATGCGLIVARVDGTAATMIDPSDGGPAWSPDGTKIALARFFGALVVMNPDGSGKTTLKPSTSGDAAWQPLPAPSYPHPQSASQLQASLVPAFRQCGTGGNPSNAKHSPPLATNSCNPPRPGSVLAAVGATSQSSAQMTVVPGDTDPTNGNQANVTLGASLTDIQSTAGGDYNPNPSGADLTAVTRLGSPTRQTDTAAYRRPRPNTTSRSRSTARPRLIPWLGPAARPTRPQTCSSRA